jgi:hypothetical protein
MAGVPVSIYQQFWADKSSSLEHEHQNLVKLYPDSSSPHKLLFKVFCDIEDLAGCTPASVGESVEWATIVSQAEENRANYCQALKGGCLFSALYGMYTVTLNALTEIARAKKANNQDDDYTEVKRRKRHIRRDKPEV